MAVDWFDPEQVLLFFANPCVEPHVRRGPIRHAIAVDGFLARIGVRVEAIDTWETFCAIHNAMTAIRVEFEASPDRSET